MPLSMGTDWTDAVNDKMKRNTRSPSLQVVLRSSERGHINGICVKSELRVFLVKRALLGDVFESFCGKYSHKVSVAAILFAVFPSEDLPHPPVPLRLF